MGLIKLSKLGLTSVYSRQSAVGYKLVIKSVVVTIVTGTVAGNRNAVVLHLDDSAEVISILASTGVFTTVSSSISAGMDPVNPVAPAQSALTGNYKDIEIFSADVFSVQMSLQTGDVVNLRMVYDEEPA